MAFPNCVLCHMFDSLFLSPHLQSEGVDIIFPVPCRGSVGIINPRTLTTRLAAPPPPQSGGWSSPDVSVVRLIPLGRTLISCRVWMSINVTKCATLYSYYWLHVCTVITLHADAQYLILLHIVPCSSTYLLLHDDTDWRQTRLRGSQCRHWSRLLWMSTVLERIRRKSVTALFS